MDGGTKTRRRPRGQSLLGLMASAVFLCVVAGAAMVALEVPYERADDVQSIRMDAAHSPRAIEATIIEASGGAVGPHSQRAMQTTTRSLAASGAPEVKDAIGKLAQRNLTGAERIDAATGSLAVLEARLAETYREDERIRTERIETLMAMGLLLSGTSPDRAAEAYRRVSEFAPEQAFAQIYLADLARASGDMDAAFAHYVSAGSASADPFLQVESLSGLSYLSIIGGDMAEAERLGLEALSHAEQTGDMRALAGARLQLARIYYREEDYARTKKLCLLSLEALGDANDPYTRATIHNTLGGVAYRSGDKPSAISQFEHAAKAFETAGYIADAAWIRGNIGVVHSVSGNLEEAERYLNAAYDTAVALGNVERRGGYAANLARLEKRMGNMDASCARTLEAAEAYGALGSPKSDVFRESHKEDGCS